MEYGADFSGHTEPCPVPPVLSNVTAPPESV